MLLREDRADGITRGVGLESSRKIRVMKLQDGFSNKEALELFESVLAFGCPRPLSFFREQLVKRGSDLGEQWNEPTVVVHEAQEAL
jgi:hypothetical protein